MNNVAVIRAGRNQRGSVAIEREEPVRLLKECLNLMMERNFVSTTVGLLF